MIEVVVGAAAIGALVWYFTGRSAADVPIPQLKPQSEANTDAAAEPQEVGQLTRAEVEDLARRTVQTYDLKADWRDLVTTAAIESSWRPHVVGDDGRSIGLMQTQLATAQDLASKGYVAHGTPDADDLRNPAVSMYFGAAYFDWLWRYFPAAQASKEWQVRAYNGGPGWPNTNAGPSLTAKYWRKWRDRRAQLYGAV